MAFGKSYSPTALPGRRHRGPEDQEESDRLIAKMEADARNAGSLGTIIGAGTGLAGGLIAAPFTGGASLAAIPGLMGAGGAIGGGIGNLIGSGSEQKADAERQRREREQAELNQRLMALGPLAASLGSRRYS